MGSLCGFRWEFGDRSEKIGSLGGFTWVLVDELLGDLCWFEPIRSV